MTTKTFTRSLHTRVGLPIVMSRAWACKAREILLTLSFYPESVITRAWCEGEIPGTAIDSRQNLRI
jgi:hypothetical protein